MIVIIIIQAKIQDKTDNFKYCAVLKHIVQHNNLDFVYLCIGVLYTNHYGGIRRFNKTNKSRETDNGSMELDPTC